MRRLTVAILTSLTVILTTASAALAVDPHQHTLTTPGTTAFIARGICINDLQRAVDNFHANVHFGTPSGAFASNGVAIGGQACPTD